MILTTERLVLREFVGGDWVTVLEHHKFIVQQKVKPRFKYQLAVML